MADEIAYLRVQVQTMLEKNQALVERNILDQMELDKVKLENKQLKAKLADLGHEETAEASPQAEAGPQMKCLLKENQKKEDEIEPKELVNSQERGRGKTVVTRLRRRRGRGRGSRSAKRSSETA